MTVDVFNKTENKLDFFSGIAFQRDGQVCLHLVEVFAAIGSEIINSDNDVAINERTDANIYIGMMKNFVEKNLHTGMQKAALTKNTLKSQYQILKKSNQ